MQFSIILALACVFAHQNTGCGQNDGDSHNREVNSPGQVVFLTQQGETRTTGGNVGCFGVDGVLPNRLYSIEQLTAGFGVVYFSRYNCAPVSQVSRQRPQDGVGIIDRQISNSDVRSIRLVELQSGDEDNVNC